MIEYLNVSVWLAASPIFSSGSDPDSPLSETVTHPSWSSWLTTSTHQGRTGTAIMIKNRKGLFLSGPDKKFF
jgi:hypothetical protein